MFLIDGPERVSDSGVVFEDCYRSCRRVVCLLSGN